jgi:hypothetical protein
VVDLSELEIARMKEEEEDEPKKIPYQMPKPPHT